MWLSMDRIEQKVGLKICFQIPHTYPVPSQVDPVKVISFYIWSFCGFVIVGLHYTLAFHAGFFFQGQVKCVLLLMAFVCVFKGMEPSCIHDPCHNVKVLAIFIAAITGSQIDPH